ncbi:MAG TPA: LysR family transcriptional regulator [Terriglobales bacterium]|nr:LysR family transcriptional regulator [Terriglobales bacterium]
MDEQPVSPSANAVGADSWSAAKLFRVLISASYDASVLPEIRQLQHVAAIGQYRSFGRAAHALGMSQPALSKSIKVLETALGVRLFERGKSGAVPTVFGQLILSRGGALIHNLDALVVEIDRMNNLASGTLSVGAGFFPYDLLVVPAVGRLARMYPGLHLRVAHADWRLVSQQVLAGTLDIGITGVARADRDAALVVEPLTAQVARFFVRRRHPLSGAAKLSLKQLAPYPFVMGPVPPRLAPFLQRAGIKGRIDPLTGDFIPAITVDSIALMNAFVRDTDGFGAAPEAAISAELKAGQFVALPVDAPWAVTEPGIIRLRERASTPALEAFLAEVRAIDRAARARVPRRPVGSQHR